MTPAAAGHAIEIIRAGITPGPARPAALAALASLERHIAEAFHAERYDRSEEPTGRFEVPRE